jgi:hypothetical protein
LVPPTSVQIRVGLPLTDEDVRIGQFSSECFC